MTTAVRRRKELVAEASRLRTEIEQKIATLEKESQESEIKVSKLEKDVSELEKKEKYKMVKSAGTGSRTAVLAGLAKQRVEELRLLLMQTRQQRDAQRSRVQELEGLLKTFKEEYNPNFNDEGVKRAVRAWEDYAAKDLEGDWESVHDRELDEILKEDGESSGINWPEWETEPTEEDQEDDVAARKYKMHQLSRRSPVNNG